MENKRKNKEILYSIYGVLECQYQVSRNGWDKSYSYLRSES